MASPRHPDETEPNTTEPSPPVTGTVVLTCPFHQSDPRYILRWFDGATAPASPQDPERGALPASALDGMHVILDIGDAPGFFDPGWNAPITARLVCRAASIEVRGANPVGVARVRADLVGLLQDARECLAVQEW